MVELALILGINLGALVLAVLLARWLSARDAGASDVQRLAAAMTRATHGFLWREFREVGLAVAVSVGVVFGAHAWLIRLGRPFGSFETAFWSSLSLCLGASSACAVAYAGGRLAALGSPRLLSAARQSVDRALTVSLRAAGATGLLAEALSVLGVYSIFALFFSMKGGFNLPIEEAQPLTFKAALLLPNFAFGAAAAALVVQRTGGIFHVAGDVGGDLAGERDAGLEHDDVRNPAAIADLVGDHVGPGALRACDLLVSITIANVAALLIVAHAQLENRATLPQGLSLVLLPAVVRAFGAIGSASGLLVVRVSEHEDPSRALWRGLLVALSVALGGLAGGCVWLLGTRYAARFFAAGALGLVPLFALVYLGRRGIDRRFAPLRSVLDAAQGGDAIAVAQGLAAGLQGVLLPIFGLAVVMAAAWQLGASSALQNGGTIGAVLCVTTLLAMASYALAVGNFGGITDNARGVLSLSSLGHDERRDRAVRLDDAGFLASSTAQTYLSVVGCLAALLAAAALPLLSGQARPQSIDLSKPAVAWSGALGATFVAVYAGSVISVACRAARSTVAEIERQLADFSGISGETAVPREYVPSYRSCIELVTKLAVSGALTPVLVALFAPAALGIALRLMYRSGEPGLWAESLVSFVVVASITGLGAALAVNGARATLGAARRASRSSGSSPGCVASMTADAVADLVGNSAGPAAQLVVRAAAVSSLIVASFLT